MTTVQPVENDNKLQPVKLEDPDIATYPTGTAYDFDAGLTNNVSEQVESPKMLLERVLIDDEKILDTFDVKFPGEFVPLWKIVMLLILTGGMYAIILGFRMVRRWCYKKRWCTPQTVHFAFGKMAVTTKGRVICWKEEVFQFKPPQKKYKGYFWIDYICVQLMWSIAKCFIIMFCPDLCAPPVIFEYDNDFKSYRIADIKQITQYMTSEASCLFCCLDYTAGVEIAFNNFNHGTNYLTVASKSGGGDEFGTEAQAAASSATMGSYYAWAKGIYGAANNVVGTVERAAGIAPNLNTIYVHTNTGDRVHNGDVDSILKDVNVLHKRLIELLPPLKDAITPEKIDFSKLKIQGGGDISVAGAGIVGNNYQKTDKFKNVTIVGNDGEISIPESWMPLLAGEEIIATNGQVPKMTCMQWFWTYLTCGVAYCLYYRRRKYTRSALVLTNKRLITIDIYERSGTVPLTLSNFSIQVRSFILDNVHNGFINTQNRFHLEAGIACDGGCLFVSFSGNGRSSFPFALAMQMSVKRKGSAVKTDLSKVAGDFKKESFPLLPWDLIPKLTGENIVNVIKGNHQWEPYGVGIWAKLCMFLRKSVNGSLLNGGPGCCWNKPVDQACSREACNKDCCCAGQEYTPFFFPCVPYIATCALRPFQYETTIVITNMSVIRVATKGNFGLCRLNKYFVTNDSMMISWEALENFSGFNLNIHGSGKENVLRRCCRGNCIGRTFCPIGLASASFSIDFKGNYSFNTFKEEPNKVWIKDPGLHASMQTLTRLQFAIQDHVLNEAKKNEKSSVTASAGSAPVSSNIDRV